MKYSSGLVCHCLYCYNSFVVVSHCIEGNIAVTDYKCGCGRQIKIEENLTPRALKQKPLTKN